MRHAAPVEVSVLPRRQIRPLHLKDGTRRLERRATYPRLDHPRVAAIRQRLPIALKVGADEDLVTSPEAHVALGSRVGAEAARHEGLGGQVELTHDLRVGPARRQKDECAVPAASGALVEHVVAMPHKVLALCDAFVGIELIEVQHVFPLRIRRAERAE